MPRVRVGLPVRGAVREPHGGDARRTPATALTWARGGVARLPGRAPAALARPRVHWVAWLAQRLHLAPSRLGLPRLSARSLARPLDVEVGGTPNAWLFTGCVMDAWLRDTHRSAVRVTRATGARVARPPASAACCGALHLHAGREAEARTLATRVMQSMPGSAPVVVDSAGCGATMKEYGHLLDSRGPRVQRRVKDFSEWLVLQPRLGLRPMDTQVVVQDPCHLRHVQKAHNAVRTALQPAYALRDRRRGAVLRRGWRLRAHTTRSLASHPRSQGRRVRGRPAHGSDRGVGQSGLHAATTGCGHRRPPSRRLDRGFPR